MDVCCSVGKNVVIKDESLDTRRNVTLFSFYPFSLWKWSGILSISVASVMIRSL